MFWTDLIDSFELTDVSFLSVLSEARNGQYKGRPRFVFCSFYLEASLSDDVFLRTRDPSVLFGANFTKAVSQNRVFVLEQIRPLATLIQRGIWLLYSDFLLLYFSLHTKSLTPFVLVRFHLNLTMCEIVYN